MKLKPWPLVIVLLLASGLAFALIPDSNGVIHGCYKNSDGSLRVIDDSVSSCRTNETPLNWNASGPPGPPGPATAAFAADSGLNPITLPSGQPTTLVSLSLPVGNYVLSGKVIVGNGATSTSQLSCQLRNEGGLGGPSALDQSETWLFAGSPSSTPAGSIAALPLVGSVSLTQQDGNTTATISILCTANNPDTFAQFAHLYAVKVATLTQQ